MTRLILIILPLLFLNACSTMQPCQTDLCFKQRQAYIDWMSGKGEYASQPQEKPKQQNCSAYPDGFGGYDIRCY